MSDKLISRDQLVVKVGAKAVKYAKSANSHYEAAKSKDGSDPHYCQFREDCAALGFAAWLVGTKALVAEIESTGVKCPPFWL